MTQLTEFEWKAVLLVYLELSRDEVPLSEGTQALRRLSSQLQLINDPGVSSPYDSFRTAKGLAYQSKCFFKLDPNSPYNYTHPRNLPELAKSVWVKYGSSIGFPTEFQQELLQRFHLAQGKRSTDVLSAPARSKAVIYLLQHNTYGEFVKIGYTERSPENRAREYTDGQWSVIGEFKTGGVDDARVKEMLVHARLKENGSWIPPQVVDGSAKEVFMCNLSDALSVVGQVLEGK